MKHSLIALALTALILGSCKRDNLIKAKIFERRELARNRLMIYYHYNFKNRIYTDSASVTNNIIKNDSILVLIDPSNPSSGEPQLNN